MPMALTLVEAIAGRERAEAVGRDIGVTDWDARHDSRAFQFTRPFAMTAIRNSVAFQLEYPTESRRAVRERANAFGQTAMTRSLR